MYDEFYEMLGSTYTPADIDAFAERYPTVDTEIKLFYTEILRVRLDEMKEVI